MYCTCLLNSLNSTPNTTTHVMHSAVQTIEYCICASHFPHIKISTYVNMHVVNSMKYIRTYVLLEVSGCNEILLFASGCRYMTSVCMYLCTCYDSRGTAPNA